MDNDTDTGLRERTDNGANDMTEGLSLESLEEAIILFRNIADNDAGSYNSFPKFVLINPDDSEKLGYANSRRVLVGKIEPGIGHWTMGECKECGAQPHQQCRRGCPAFDDESQRLPPLT